MSGWPPDALHRAAGGPKLKACKGVPMPGLDETKQFVPLKIAVLTISDTRALAADAAMRRISSPKRTLRATFRCGNNA